ncbi:hypothetical protein DB30_01386 [Enhygromyxa salina]|uniref:Uncharacterized protein n=1 Tax=Enhygromyxa salina TaxID=215803 RepID=A0A0C2DF73_9BACT|nr:hypothetical protein DB30_01386 [Enhygromyxa salina]
MRKVRVGRGCHGPRSMSDRPLSVERVSAKTVPADVRLTHPSRSIEQAARASGERRAPVDLS